MKSRRRAQRRTRSLFLLAVLSICAPAPITAGSLPFADPGAAPITPGQAGAKPADAVGPYAEGVVLVSFRHGAAASARGAARRSVHAQSHRRVSPLATDLERLTLPKGTSVAAAVNALRQNPAVGTAQPDWVVRIGATSNDPLFAGGYQWGLYGPGLTPASSYGIRASLPWSSGRLGSHSVVVGIIDSGIDITHPDLAPNIWTNPFETPGNGLDDDGNGYIDDLHGWDFFNDDASVYDSAVSDVHGTHVAGTIGGAGGNGTGVAGVSWAVTMISAKFIQDVGYTSGAIAALDYLTDLKVRHGLNVVATSNSWGGGEFEGVLEDAINRGGDSDILFVAAAGNDNADNDAAPVYPTSYACSTRFDTGLPRGYDCLISVAAINAAGDRASFSNYGATTVDIGAPGEDIVSTYPGGQYASMSGTSMAAPHVTGALALLAACQSGPTASALRSTILGLAAPTPSLVDITVTGARLDVGGLAAVCNYTDVAPPSATLSAPATPTKATTLTYGLTFDEHVTGLTSGDFTRTGTATGCVVGAPTGSGARYALNVTGCSAGTVVLTLKSNAVTDDAANAGPALTVGGAIVTIDRTVPTTGTPTTSLRTGVSVSGANIPIKVAWTGADTGGAGIARYELSVSTNAGSTWSVISTSLPSPSYNLSSGTSGTRKFRVRAIDRAGNVGAWVNGPTFSPRIVQQSSTAITYSGTWSTSSYASYCGGTARYASVAGRSASYTFTGRAIAFVTTLAATRGAVKIYIDGTLQATIDLVAPTSAFRRLAWQRTWTSAGSHTLKLVVVGTAGRPRIDLDALAVLK